LCLTFSCESHIAKRIRSSTVRRTTFPAPIKSPTQPGRLKRSSSESITYPHHFDIPLAALSTRRFASAKHPPSRQSHAPAKPCSQFVSSPISAYKRVKIGKISGNFRPKSRLPQSKNPQPANFFIPAMPGA
jgi:hypothetical protein